MSVELDTIQPIDYAEVDDENAHAAMLAERDALQARVKELERDLANARRDIEYLKGKVEAANALLKEAREMVEFWGGYTGDYFKEKWDFAGELAKLDADLAVSALKEQP